MEISIDKENLYNQLKDKTTTGLEEILNNSKNKQYEDRLNYELGCIKGNVGIMRYLLYVSNITDFSRQNNIFIGNGRGSSNSSLINYALGITNIDPIKYNLIFERFFDRDIEKEIDIDLECGHNTMDFVVNYIKSNYNYNDIIHFNVDILSNRYLDKIQKTLHFMKEPINLSDISLDDKKIYEIFCKADTTEIINFDNIEIQKFLKRLLPTCFDELSATISLIRPSSMDLIDEYLNRKNNVSNIEYIDETLIDILKPTYGVLIYQEQIIEIIKFVGNFSYGEAESMRKLISKKSLDNIEKIKIKFINNALKNNYDEIQALKIYDFIINGANKTFLKSHAISVALLAYQMAYLKVYYPSEFNK